jgi:hypothetical protein
MVPVSDAVRLVLQQATAAFGGGGGGAAAAAARHATATSASAQPKVAAAPMTERVQLCLTALPLGRRLAEDIRAERAVPPFRASMMVRPPVSHAMHGSLRLSLSLSLSLARNPTLTHTQTQNNHQQQQRQQQTPRMATL